jgi:hypothetical protein
MLISMTLALYLLQPPPPPAPVGAAVAVKPVAAQAPVSPSTLKPAQQRKLEQAVQELRQAAYEFGIHLTLGESNVARQELRTVWTKVSKVRSLGCPAKVRDAVQDAISAAGKEAFDRQSEKLRQELTKGGFGARLPELDRAIAQGKSGAWPEARTLLLGIQDDIAGDTAGFGVKVFSETLRRAERELGTTPTADSMRRALATLKTLPGAPAAIQRALTESLEIVDNTVATAADLYTEGYFRDAAESFRNMDRALRLLQRVDDPAFAMRARQLAGNIAQARLLIERGVTPPSWRWNAWNSDQEQGFALLRQVRSEAAELLERVQYQGAGSAAPAPR